MNVPLLQFYQYIFIIYRNFLQMDLWPNGKALDYESRDSRFDPEQVHFFPLPYFFVSLDFPAIRDRRGSKFSPSHATTTTLC